MGGDKGKRFAAERDTPSKFFVVLYLIPFVKQRTIGLSVNGIGSHTSRIRQAANRAPSIPKENCTNSLVRGLQSESYRVVISGPSLGILPIQQSSIFGMVSLGRPREDETVPEPHSEHDADRYGDYEGGLARGAVVRQQQSRFHCYILMEETSHPIKHFKDMVELVRIA